MTILVTGGTGTLGREVVTQLAASAGPDVRILSRRARRDTDPPSAGWAVGDLRTGAGLAAALAGTSVVLHCASNPYRARDDLAAARQLIDAARAAGGPHLIYVSIVGVDRVQYGYYRAKLEVEQMIERSGLPWTVLRATQFHDLVAYILQWGARLPVLLYPAGVSFQPVDTRDVAGRLARLAAGDPAGRVADFGGPLVQPVPDLARAWLRAAGVRRPLAPVRLPGRLFRGYAAGGHLAPQHADGRITFEQFLTAHVSPASHSARYGQLR
jgi:uncharacterized protein YbjT (DUF2867 family)